MERSFWSTIRGKILSRTLVVVLIPVLVIGGAAVYALQSLSSTADSSVEDARTTLTEDVVGSRIAAASDQIAREIAIFLDERLADAEAWSDDRVFIRAARAGAARADQLGLNDLEIEEIEEIFAEEPRLADDSNALDRSLSEVISINPAFKEVFLTDVNGYNVDYTNQTSDFVQSDEEWWRLAMEEGVHISTPGFDASSGVFSVDLSFRLDDAGIPVGVMKSSLDIALVQEISDRFTGTADSYDVAIIDSDGRFLAETSSEHDPTHIMSTTYLAADALFANPRIAVAMSPTRDTQHPEGFSIHPDAIGGYGQVGEQLEWLRGDMDTSLRPFGWTVVVEQPSDVAFASLAPIEGLADDLSSTSTTLMIVVAFIAGGGLILAALVALTSGRRLTKPIAQLRDAAVQAAEVTLPSVVAQMDELEEDDALPALEPLVLETGDEVEDLAQSFNTVQQTAANLASEQARLRRKNVATTFVNLGRRNQNLLARQLEHINSMESTETDPGMLQRLFQLDHLATRMRRNAESLLVLAGEETPRRFRRPVAMHQLLQAAGGEVEDFSRIQFGTVDEVGVEGGVASDVAHLLAELLENASSFSPPDTSIALHGRRTDDGYWLAVVDQGIGMQPEEMIASNERLSSPAEFDRAPSAYLGHFVVGHLSRRHGIRVELTPTPNGGTTAHLQLPKSVLVDAPVAFPASSVVAEASPDTHVAIAEDESVRQMAAMSASDGAITPGMPDAEAAFSPPAEPSMPTAAPSMDQPEAREHPSTFEQAAAAPLDPAPAPQSAPDPAPPVESLLSTEPLLPTEALVPHDAFSPSEPALPSEPVLPIEATPPSHGDVTPTHDPGLESASVMASAPAPVAPAPLAPVAPAPLAPVAAPPVAPAVQPPVAPVAPVEAPSPVTTAPVEAPAPVTTAPVEAPAPVAAAPVEAPAPVAATPVAQPLPAQAMAPAPGAVAPTPVAPAPAPVAPAVASPAVAPTPGIQAPAASQPLAHAAPPLPGSRPVPAAPAQPAARPAPAPSPAASPAPISPSLPPLPTSPPTQPPVLMSTVVDPPAPTSPDKTRSGFRKRRRGKEGAPEQAAAPAEPARLAPNPPRRSPEEVQASLARFRQGVEAGRAHGSAPSAPAVPSAAHEHPDHPSTHQPNHGGGAQ
ncbi:MAG: ATP-binding protein [Actinomycetota bacterium]